MSFTFSNLFLRSTANEDVEYDDLHDKKQKNLGKPMIFYLQEQ